MSLLQHSPSIVSSIMVALRPLPLPPKSRFNARVLVAGHSVLRAPGNYVSLLTTSTVLSYWYLRTEYGVWCDLLCSIYGVFLIYFVYY